MYCKHCGNKLVEGAKFCGKCGRDSSGASPASTSHVSNGGSSTGFKVLIAVLIGIPALGILAGIVLASLGSARENVAQTTQTTQSGGWVTYNSISERFSVLFPAYPAVDSQLDTTDDTNEYVYNSYIAQKGSATFNVFDYRFKEPIDVSSPNALLESFLNRLTNGAGGTLTSSNYTYYSTYHALDFLIDANTELIKGRIILIGQTPYILAYDYPAGAYIDSDYQRFINSFEFK